MRRTTTDNAQLEIEDTECPLCGGKWDDDKHKNNEKNCEKNGYKKDCKKNKPCAWGNIGISGRLATQIANGLGKTKDEYIKKQLENYNGVSLAAHHLICSEAMKDDQDWAKICFLTGYNINCCKNGVFLPNTLKHACSAKVPLHRSSHKAGYGGEGSSPGETMAYPVLVIEMTQSIKNSARRFKACEDPEKLKNIAIDLNETSKRIFNSIKNFTMTLTSDGFDYQKDNIIGCACKESIPSKRRLKQYNKMYKERKEIEGIGIEDRSKELKSFFEEIKKGTWKELKCTNERKHYNAKNKEIKEYDLEISH